MSTIFFKEGEASRFSVSTIDSKWSPMATKKITYEILINKESKELAEAERIHCCDLISMYPVEQGQVLSVKVLVGGHDVQRS